MRRSVCRNTRRPAHVICCKIYHSRCSLYHLSRDGCAQGVHHHRGAAGRSEVADAVGSITERFTEAEEVAGASLARRRDSRLLRASGAGYVLHRAMEEWGYASEGIAPSLIPKRSGVQRKHDKRDAADLARFYRAGELTAVRIPSESDERVRDVVRCRETFQKEILRSRHYILKFLARRGFVFREGTNWCSPHLKWLLHLTTENSPLEQHDRLIFREYHALLLYKLERRERAGPSDRATHAASEHCTDGRATAVLPRHLASHGDGTCDRDRRLAALRASVSTRMLPGSRIQGRFEWRPHTTRLDHESRLSQPGEGHPHPRAYGTFPRVLGEYVRVQKLMPLETAVHKMTGMPAKGLGLSDRGVLREGAFADIVIFDAALIRDQATFIQPHQYPVGIEIVIVNGAIAVEGGKATGIRAGRVLVRPWQKTAAVP